MEQLDPNPAGGTYVLGSDEDVWVSFPGGVTEDPTLVGDTWLLDTGSTVRVQNTGGRYLRPGSRLCRLGPRFRRVDNWVRGPIGRILKVVV